MKKTLLLILSLCTWLPLCAFDFEIEGVFYNFIDNNEVEVTQGSPMYSGNVVIPSSVTYNGQTYTVTKIGEKAFYECMGLRTVSIPEGVKK